MSLWNYFNITAWSCHLSIYVICRNGNTYLTPLDIHPELLFFTILKGAQCIICPWRMVLTTVLLAWNVLFSTTLHLSLPCDKVAGLVFYLYVCALCVCVFCVWVIVFWFYSILWSTFMVNKRSIILVAMATPLARSKTKAAYLNSTTPYLHAKYFDISCKELKFVQFWLIFAQIWLPWQLPQLPWKFR